MTVSSDGRVPPGGVIARAGTQLVGFVNAVGDGGRHAFLVDTAVAPTYQGAGIGVHWSNLQLPAVETAAPPGCTSTSSPNSRLSI